ncbi:Hydantoinase B/oxoprolinase-domain-containing protein [Xylaria digitata]|nr:Hydantoinase B/oxoprolinase-domain-containing protein [Xylaria digitata]
MGVSENFSSPADDAHAHALLKKFRNTDINRQKWSFTLLSLKGMTSSNQARPEIFDQTVAEPRLLYEFAIEVDERVTLEGYAENPAPEEVDTDKDDRLHVGLTGEVVRVIKPLNIVAAREPLQKLWDASYRSLKNSGTTLQAAGDMDDGTPIGLSISIDGETGSAVSNFTSTGPQVYTNTNAPIAITNSAIIYSIRTLIDAEIPLNQGCLAPIGIRVPEFSILAPAPGTSVVGRNVLMSQRIVDVVLTAFGVRGKHINPEGKEVVEKGFGYYETMGGGAGAGPSWKGSSSVHMHITNTRITDPEVFEKRYPVLLREFSIRKGTGCTGVATGLSGKFSFGCQMFSYGHEPVGTEGI